MGEASFIRRKEERPSVFQIVLKIQNTIRNNGKLTS